MKKLKLLLVALSIITISCQKDDDVSSNNDLNQTPNSSTFSENFGNQISRTFLGNVVDNTNNPLSGVLIKIGNQTATTDNNGVFIIQDATVNERFGNVTAEKAGFIHASRTVVPTEGTNNITIMMLPETIAGSTSSGAQDVISLSNGASVSLQGDYIKEDGTSYSGNVNVILHHLDPTDQHMENQMPGMLYAANAQNEEVMLQSFGMLAIELRGDNGEDLNLAEGSSAEIRVPLDASLLADAPSTIPLWYFDEVNGYWVEDGEATLIGNEYVGTVTHFSFWNVSNLDNFVNLCITFTNVLGEPMLGLDVRLNSSSLTPSRGITDENGQVCGFVPSNEILELDIVSSNSCNLLSVYAEDIGPFSSDISLNRTIPNEVPGLFFETIVGQFENCNGELVTNGYVRIIHEDANSPYDYSNSSHFALNPITDGSFEFSFLRCSEEFNFSIQGYDYDSLNQTDLLNYTFEQTITNVGTISACTDSSEYVIYIIDNSEEVAFTSLTNEGSQRPYILVPEDESSTVPALKINATRSSPINNNTPYIDEIEIFGFLNEAQFIGQYEWGLDLENGNPGFVVTLFNDFGNYYYIVDANNNVTFDVINIGDVGEFIDLTFSGTYMDVNGITHTVAGEAHVIREE